MNRSPWFGVSIIATIIFSGCVNPGGGTVPSTSSSSKATGSTTTTSTVQFTMLKPTVTADTDATKPPIFALAFDSSRPTPTITDYCQVSGDTAKSCNCQFTWASQNLATGQTYQRTAVTAITQVATYSATCPGPDFYQNEVEIPEGTVIQISLVPNLKAGNSSGFSTTPWDYTKSALSGAGDFQDIEGHSFKNVYHYVCYDLVAGKFKISRGTQQESYLWGTSNSSDGGLFNVKLSNSFLVEGAGYSAQSYYYDFYVRTGETGSPNAGSANFVCPRVSNLAGTGESYFPMDSTFAIALNSSPVYSVPIRPNLVVAPAGATPAPTPPVLGYAARANSDGTCPTIKVGGQDLRTYRLRQYRVLYPLRFDAAGAPLDQEQPLNRVLILDRPLVKAGSTTSLSRLGPKPCPVAFKAAIGTASPYKCIADKTWFGTGLDAGGSFNGLNLRNVDGMKVDADATCPIYPAPPDQYFNFDGDLVIRPFYAVLPYYIEDTNFQACALPSQSAVDPEIMVVHNTSYYPGSEGPQDFYCAVHYPQANQISNSSGIVLFDRPSQNCTADQFMAALNSFSRDESNASPAGKNPAAKGYACTRTSNPFNTVLTTPASGCCQKCSGSCGGIAASLRNAAPMPSGVAVLGRGRPNVDAGSCYDAYEQ